MIKIINERYFMEVYMNRRKSREIATRLLFEMSINKESYVDIIENFRENTEEKIEDIDFEYVIRVLKGVSENEAYINETISKYLIKWKIERLPKMNLAILKMAAYEILFEEDIPNKVTINEAIELAKKYGDDNAPSFINGVLNNLIKK
jgi:N utilization substance protein B